MPGFLIPSDLERLIPDGVDPFVWSEGHLRASFGSLVPSGGVMKWTPSLVPAKADSGSCHWLKDGRCTVHENSPFGCAFLDQHMTDREAEKRSQAGRDARWDDFVTDGLYSQIWQHLSERGLVYRTSQQDRLKVIAAHRELRLMQEARAERACRSRARERKREERCRKKASRR
jgi:hypothetical protein